ncbi:PDZ domain-containing protein [Marinobacter lacisalsi]|uniref:PDZ domain-containing protein n=1 Tax=Marinobacter lacisalsi TaxID=475979 RepID=A0ABV8QCP8_9GAMM
MTSKGVTVELVREGSAAEQAGLQKGDVITSYNGTPVRTANHLTNAIKGGKGKPEAVVHYQRGDGDIEQVTVASGPLGIQSKDIAPQAAPPSAKTNSNEPSSFWTKLIMFVATLILLLNIAGAVFSVMANLHLMTIVAAAESVLFGLFYYGVAWVLVRIWENSVVIRQQLSR